MGLTTLVLHKTASYPGFTKHCEHTALDRSRSDDAQTAARVGYCCKDNHKVYTYSFKGRRQYGWFHISPILTKSPSYT